MQGIVISESMDAPAVALLAREFDVDYRPALFEDEAGLARSSTVAVGLDELEQLTREIQDSVMAIRAQPVKSVFQRMPRLVREVAAQTGKPVRLVTEGEGTEVDKTVIERLTDPLTHMIRNAIDHGRETPEQRRAAGKPEECTVRQAALHLSIATLMGAGSHIVASTALYGGSQNLLHYTMRRFGIETTFVKPGDIDGWRAAIRPRAASRRRTTTCRWRSTSATAAFLRPGR